MTVAGKKFWLLVPGASEMMSSVERGAQIITPKDAATILMELNIKSGDKVLEAGVGSAALTIALLNQVRPWGQVISMEIRPEFAEKGKRNVDKAGLAEGWRLEMGDVRKDRLDIVADAAVLDMPDPWDAVDNVSTMLRNGGRFCAYVPNTNQLEEIVRQLEQERLRGDTKLREHAAGDGGARLGRAAVVRDAGPHGISGVRPQGLRLSGSLNS